MNSSQKKTNDLLKVMRTSKATVPNSPLNVANSTSLMPVDLIQLYTKARPSTSNNVINFWMEILNAREKIQWNDKPKCFFHKCIDVSDFRRGPKWENLISYGQDEYDFFYFQTIIFPLYYGDNHWVIAVIDLFNKELLILNSLYNNKKDRKCANHLIGYIKRRYESSKSSTGRFSLNEWNTVLSENDVVHIPQQDPTYNTNDCVPFCVLYTESIQLQLNSFEHIDHEQLFSGYGKADFRKLLVKLLLSFDVEKHSVKNTCSSCINGERDEFIYDSGDDSKGTFIPDKRLVEYTGDATSGKGGNIVMCVGTANTGAGGTMSTNSGSSSVSDKGQASMKTGLSSCCDGGALTLSSGSASATGGAVSLVGENCSSVSVGSASTSSVIRQSTTSSGNVESKRADLGNSGISRARNLSSDDISNSNKDGFTMHSGYTTSDNASKTIVTVGTRDNGEGQSTVISNVHVSCVCFIVLHEKIVYCQFLFDE